MSSRGSRLLSEPAAIFAAVVVGDGGDWRAAASLLLRTGRRPPYAAKLLPEHKLGHLTEPTKSRKTSMVHRRKTPDPTL